MTSRAWWRAYNAYLESPQWRQRRRKVLIRSGGWCEMCHHRRPEHVHHLTYKRVGRERLTDLIALCRDCHSTLHGRPAVIHQPVIFFRVLGRPQPAGSSGVPIRKGGQVVKVAVIDAAKHSRPWKDSVASAAQDAVTGHHLHDLLRGPLLLVVDFYVARPLGHYRTGANAALVREGAPPYPAVRPDTTKLLRAIEDAMTGIVWRDDAQVVDQRARKLYGTPERAEIWVRSPA